VEAEEMADMAVVAEAEAVVEEEDTPTRSVVELMHGQ
jgi:hypothetical protein